MPNMATVDATELRVLEALSKSGLVLDSTQVAERASVLPADADAALHSLVRKDIVVRVSGHRKGRPLRYVAR